MPVYDSIGRTYTTTRRPDPRIGTQNDCTDGFAAAYWCRPRAYLDPAVRAGMSVLAQPGEDALEPGLRDLAADLDSGRWHQRHGDLMRLDQFDAGYRLLVADL